MPTVKADITNEWTDLGAGPMSAAINRGRVWFWQGDTAPADLRSGYLLSAQGQQRLASFSKSGKVWARAADEPTTAIVITGQLGQAASTSATVYECYAEIPDPTSVKVGTFAVVSADPIDSLNGLHVALGAAPDQMATFWAAAS